MQAQHSERLRSWDGLALPVVHVCTITPVLYCTIHQHLGVGAIQPQAEQQGCHNHHLLCSTMLTRASRSGPQLDHALVARQDGLEVLLTCYRNMVQSRPRPAGPRAASAAQPLTKLVIQHHAIPYQSRYTIPPPVIFGAGTVSPVLHHMTPPPPPPGPRPAACQQTPTARCFQTPWCLDRCSPLMHSRPLPLFLSTT
jgi:hypothetical protein